MKGNQKRYLRAEAHHIKPVFQVGKNDISDNFIEQVLEYLDKNELVKISILNNSMYDVSDLETIFEECEVTTVQKIGKTIVLYKQSSVKENIKYKLPNWNDWVNKKTFSLSLECFFIYSTLYINSKILSNFFYSNFKFLTSFSFNFNCISFWLTSDSSTHWTLIWNYIFKRICFKWSQ